MTVLVIHKLVSNGTEYFTVLKLRLQLWSYDGLINGLFPLQKTTFLALLLMLQQ
jgi:hypothetical protein